MTLIEGLGFLATAGMGICLGLMGAGGAILTVPILVYLFRMDPVVATGHSLFIVGLTALSGALNYMRRGWFNAPSAVLFAGPGLIVAFFTRAFLLPAIPEYLFSLGTFVMTKDLLVMICFATLMILASLAMFRGNALPVEGSSVKKLRIGSAVFQGAFVGFITGFVGAGGGFMMVPALIYWRGLPMKMAVGTSLIVIAVNSLVGFTGAMVSMHNLRWGLLAALSAVAALGIYMGSRWAAKASEQGLKKLFAIFVFVLGVVILVRQMA